MRSNINLIGFSRWQGNRWAAYYQFYLEKKCQIMVSQQRNQFGKFTYDSQRKNTLFKVTKINEQHQFEMLFVHHNFLEANTYIYLYILTGIDASQDTIQRDLFKTKKASEVAFVLGGVFKYSKVFQCVKGSEFRINVAKLLEKHNAKVQRTPAKYKHTLAAFPEAFNKELGKQLLKLMDTLKNSKISKKYW